MRSDTTSLMAGGILVYAVIMIAVIAFGIFVWWKIFSKAGYSGALSLLLFVPIANLIVILMLAFGEWPILQELKALRQQAMMRQSYPQGPQGPYPSNPQYPKSNPQYPNYPNYRG